MSYHTLSAKPLNKSLKALLKRTSHIGLGLGAFTPVLALANPTGGQVMAGQASITASSANGMVVHQASQSAIINWQQFDIGAGQYVQFLQPSSSSVVLNRVVGGSATSIFGNLIANGQVFLVNTNGVFFGKGASVDTQGFLASSLDISDSDFLAKNYLFNKSGSGSAGVVNQGNINAHNGGYVVLAGDYSENDGIISAQSGHVILASGARSTLTLNGNSLVSYVVNGATLSALAGVKNAGRLEADGGTVIMTADVANALKATVVNNTGLVEARNISKSGSNIILSATGGNIVNAGTLDADALTAGRTGGNIVLQGDGVTSLTDNSKITSMGLGAGGGNLELSGRTLKVRGAATLGKGGHLLLDPTSVEIITGTASTAGTGGLGAGTGGTGLTKLGVGFIQGRLNSGAAVAISAHNLIDASAGVTAITATGTGNLSFKVHNGGQINLSGVDITIGGNLATAIGVATTSTVAAHAAESFGQIVAKNVDIEAGTGTVKLAKDVVNSHGAITNYSVKANGGALFIDAAKVIGTGSLAFDDVGGSIGIHGAVSSGEGPLHGGVTLLGKSVDVTGKISAKGNVTVAASAGYASLNSVQASSGAIAVTAKGSNLRVNTAVTHGGGITLIDSAGTLHAGFVDATGTGNVAITDKSGTVTLGDVDTGVGNIAVNATGQTVSFSGEAGLFAHGNLAVTAKAITHSNSSSREMIFQAGGNIGIAGQVSMPGHNDLLKFSAGGKIVVDHGFGASHGAVEVFGQHLFYTGGGKNFSISAGDGNLILDASIGSAAKPANYNVNLKDGGYGLFIEKSIYTGATPNGVAANITATQTGHNGGSIQGVLVGNSSGAAVTLSAPGSVTLSGFNVGVGSIGNAHSSSYGPVTIAAGRNVVLSATGHHASGGGNVGVVAGNADASYGGVNNSILISAGNNLAMSGERIFIRGGSASANLNSAHALASANANVVLNAGNKVFLTGGTDSNGAVNIQGGNVQAYADAGAHQTRTATAAAVVAINGGNGITIHADRVQVSGGSKGVADATGGESAAVAVSKVNASVALKSRAGNITLTGASVGNGSVEVRGGNFVGENEEARTSAQGGKATTVAHGDVALVAAGAINLTANNVAVSGGYGAGWQNSSHSSSVVSKANAKGAAASFTATNTVAFAAGTNISLTGKNSVSVRGGSGILNGARVYADGGSSAGGATAKATASGRVTFNAGGNISLLANNIGVSGGYSAGAQLGVEGQNAGKATVNADGGVGFKAASIAIGSAGDAGGAALRGGNGAAASDALTAFSYGGGVINANSRVDLAATGNITVTDKRVFIGGGSSAAVNGSSGNRASDHGVAALNANTGVRLQAGGTVALTGGLANSASYVIVRGGKDAGASFTLGAENHGKASLDALSSVAISAAAVTAKAYNVFASGGSRALASDNLYASGAGAVTATGKNGVTIATGNLLLQGAGNVIVQGGGGAAAHLGLDGEAGTATATANGDVNLIASGTATLFASNHNVFIGGGGGAGISAGVYADTSGKALLTATGNANVIGGTVKIKSANGEVIVDGGYGVAADAYVQGYDGGSATLTANGMANVRARTGNLAVTAKTGIFVRGGRDAAAGHSSSYTRSTSTVSNGTGSYTKRITNHFPQVHYTEAWAGSSGKATLTGNAGVNFAAKGTISLSQTSASHGSIAIGGGSSAGRNAVAQGQSSGAAVLNALSNVTMKAGALSVSGRRVNVFGGQRAAHGAQDSRSSSYILNHSHSGATSHTSSSVRGPSHGNSSMAARATQASSNAKATLNTDTSILLQAGTVAITANGGNLDISGGYRGAESAKVQAFTGGTATVNTNSGVAIAATGAVTLAAKGGSANVNIGGAGSSGRSALVDAGSSGATVASKAALNTNGAVSISGATVAVTAGNFLFVGGGHSAAKGAAVTASSMGSAALNAQGGVNFKAATAFTAALSGSGNDGGLQMFGGWNNGRTAHVSAGGSGANAALNTKDDVNVTVTGSGGVLTMTTGKHKGAQLLVNAGSSAARSAQVTAGSGGKATAAVSQNANLTAARGTIALSATQGNLALNGGRQSFSPSSGTAVGGHNAQKAFVAAGSSAAASFTANTNVNLRAGTIKVHAGTYKTGSHSSNTTGGSIAIRTNGQSDAKSAAVLAGAKGISTFNLNDQVNILATGALVIGAGGSLDVGINCCSNHGAFQAKAVAGGSSAKATMNLNGSTLLQGNAAVVLTAGKDITLTTVSGGIGNGATAGAKGTATFNQVDQLNIRTAGAFTMKAGSNAVLNPADGQFGEQASASGAGAQANYTLDNSVNVSANTVAISAGSEIFAGAGGIVGWNGSAAAVHNGVATLTVNSNLNITAKSAIAMTLTGSGSGGSITIGNHSAGAVGMGAEATANSHGGKAKLTDSGNTNLTVTGTGGTITLSAGKHKGASVDIYAGGAGRALTSSGFHQAGAGAGAGGSASANFLANTTLSAKGAVTVNAGASGDVTIAGGGYTLAYGVAFASGGKAKVNGQGVVNISGGAVTLTAGHDIAVTAASQVAVGAGSSTFTGVLAKNGGNAAMTAQTGVKITTAGAFTAAAGSNLYFVTSGSSTNAKTAASARVEASHGGAQATLTATNTIQVNAGAIALKATAGSLVIAGGSGAAARAKVMAEARNDKAALSVNDSISMVALGNFAARAGGSMLIAGGRNAGSSASAFAQNHGSAKLGVNASVNIKAGGNLALVATHDLNVNGGVDAGGSFNAQNAGSASANFNAGVNLTAGRSATLAAGGNLTLAGGNSAFLLADEFFNLAPSSSASGVGKVKGTLTTAVTLTAHSNAVLTAGGNLTVAAGAGETVAVGAYRTRLSSSTAFNGHSWEGGSANLSANVGAAVTVGKNLTLTAGTAGSGSLQVMGLGANPRESSQGLHNVVSVRGGSSHAVATVTMTGNALLTAGLDIIVNAAGNASIVGGIINDVRVDHALGKVSLTGSADAGLHAGLDVLLNNITGSLTLAGANAGPSEQGMLVDAHGNFGTAVAIGHADAGISAGRDIVAVKPLGGGLNLMGGDLVDAVALGFASSQHANGTANASLKAGRNIIVSGAGGLNLLGGQFDAASAEGSSRASVGSGSRTAVMQAHAAVAAGGGVSLKFTGDGFLAGGNSVAAKVSYNGAFFDVGKASADAGVSVTGTSVALNVGGNLLVRGGSGAKAEVTALGGGIAGSANDNVGINIAATKGNVAIAVGGSASFLGGSGVGGKVINISGVNNSSFGAGPNVANATAHADVNIGATGNIAVTLTGTGNLTIAATPDAEQFGTVAGGISPGRIFPSSAGTPTATDGKTNVTASGAVTFTAGGAIAVKQTGGNLTILGGSNAASFASAQARGSNAATTLTVNANVLIKAAGAIAFTGANNVTVSGGKPATGSASPFQYVTTSGSGATVTEKLDASVKFSGTTVSVAHTGTKTVNSGGSTFSSGGLSQTGSVTGLPAAVHGLVVHNGLLRVTPATSGVSFGGMQPLSAAPVTAPAATQSVVGATPASVNVQTTPVALSTLQAASLVPSLVTMLGTDAGSTLGSSLPMESSTLFTPAVDSGAYGQAFSGSCTALVVKGSDARCSTGGK